MINSKHKSQIALLEALQDAGLPVVSVVDDKPRYSRVLTTEEQSTAQVIVDNYANGAFDYKDNRVYPTIEDQLDMLYWDKVNGTDNWRNTIAAVKAAHPKD
jgi:hypothetical protein